MQFEGAGITLERNVIAMLSECGDIPPMYEDPDFAARAVSLFKDADAPPEYATSTKKGDDGAIVHWYRPSQVCVEPDYFKSTAGCGTLREGSGLNDAWLLGVFAALALHQDNLIENLFVSQMHDFKTFGIYTCQFYKDCQWLEVVADTRLPYSQPIADVNDPRLAPPNVQPGHWLYGSSLNKNEVFIPLLEKAYAKFHGNYEVLHDGSIVEAFIDCTGGSVKKIDLSSDATRKTLVETGVLWSKLLKHHSTYKSVLSCQLKMASMSYNDVTTAGILKNRLYVIMHLKELGSLRFIKLKNVWQRGSWKGDWSNDDCKWEDNLQVEAALRADAACDFNRTKNDGTFWMVWEDFVETFNEVFITRIFPSSTCQYCVRGEWIGPAAAGPPTKPATETHPSVDDEHAKGPSTRAWTVQGETDPSWFRNPQYRLVVDDKCTVLLSLLQRDFRVFGGDNFAINFVVLEVSKKALHASIVWEYDKARVVAEAHSYPPHDASKATLPSASTSHPEREISKGNVVLEPGRAYVVVPYTDHAGVDMEFFLRIFSSKAVQIDALRPLHALAVHGKWRATDDGGNGNTSSAGGPLCLSQGISGPENLSWCQNPQFLLRMAPKAADAKRPVTIKIVAKQTSYKVSTKGRRDAQKDKAHALGLSVVRPDVLVDDTATTKKRVKAEKVDFLGETKGPSRAPKAPPIPERKLLVKADEWCTLSDHASPLIATLFLRKVNPDWLVHGLWVVPSLGEPLVEGTFEIEVHSDDVVTLDEVPSIMAKTIAGEWNEHKNTVGGAHLNPDWKKNPKFYLTLQCVRPANVVIHLHRSEHEWRSKCKKDSVGTMMGFYLFQGAKIQRDASSVTVDGRMWTETDFVPMHSVASPPLSLPALFNESYVIMPTTWEPNRSGRFLLSVSADCDFTLLSEDDA
ncbi:hypothetical protein SDRG_04766 [Saprolegnia diclina VS20]|uniref:Calpain catalytic domain-containing protein n=1 Tax=Saprolegnia diclina (strain VS20) TaxID=1156394 RepID=T0QIA7_SAPDV|nr:hypothetical protein SDRG_04766 [Saprolegnia diclina VS20]EQC37739.1 hypothetical protein SDRG_04766 [Saprolegnia diclina VS20]|eukprot:XP_008608672.1 hypothetical protein SDRG_04766 [Saprolegnia diclina VS20]